MAENIINNENIETVVEKDKDTANENTKKHSAASTRFFKFLDMIWNLASLCGYRVESRIEVTDLKTGKVWK